MTKLVDVCSKDGVIPGLIAGSAYITVIGAISVAPWREISVISACATAGTLVASISLITVAVKIIFDTCFGDESGWWRTMLDWSTKTITAVPFTAFLLNQSLFTKDLGISTFLRVGSNPAGFQGAIILFGALFMVSCVAETIQMLRNKRTYATINV